MDEEPVIERQSGVPVLSPSVRSVPIIAGVANSNRIPFIRRGAAQVMPAGIPYVAPLSDEEAQASIRRGTAAPTSKQLTDSAYSQYGVTDINNRRGVTDHQGILSNTGLYDADIATITGGPTRTDETSLEPGSISPDGQTAIAAADSDNHFADKLAHMAEARADAANADNFRQPATAQTGLTTAQTGLITGGINAGVAAIGSILNFVGQTASRDQQMEMAQMQIDLQRGNQEMQAAQASGNRALQLQLAQMQNDRLERTANLAAAAGADNTAQQLQLLRRQNQELIAGQRVTSQAMTSSNNTNDTNTGVPTWALIAGTIAFVAVGAGVIYWVATKDDSEEAEAEEYPRSLAQRRLANKRNLYRNY